MAKKPRGYVGSVTVGQEVGGMRHEAVPFPETKEEIERLVIETFGRALDHTTREKFGITGFTKLPDENDLDCRVHSTRGDWLMDLVECVPAKLGGGGHEIAPNAYVCGETADRMVELIRAKSNKYAALKSNPWLLMYATAWQFMPTNHEFTVVEHALINAPPQLGRVFFLYLFSGGQGGVTLLYPVDPDERQRVLEANIPQLRAGTTVLNDLRKGQMVVRDGKAVAVFPLGRMKW